ncbi:hypothetical protein APR04_002196 [Promicromonospora umidemergens]|uniref:TOBE domain-containing protein n=1 Tax=Promicromonospora umidemergens TaxID=629679 RepID=A0ABP8WP33_9MICO|nr:hypothetical protein [Promicromonospora umidemergens]
MHGVVLASIDGQGSDLRIQTDIGPILGVWRGDSPVNSGESVDVELEFPNSRAWGDIASHASAEAARNVPSDLIVGTVIEFFDDGILMVKIGGSIVQVELDDSPSGDLVGATVAIAPDDLEIYPTGL